jgi:hypothetical protein
MNLHFESFFLVSIDRVSVFAFEFPTVSTRIPVDLCTIFGLVSECRSYVATVVIVIISVLSGTIYAIH